MAKLTDKKDAFCREYIIDFNATKAAIRAGFSARTAQAQSSRLMSLTEVKERIAELIKVRNESLGISAEYVLSRLIDIDRMDAADILDDAGNILPVKDWPWTWRTTLSGLDIISLGNADNPDAILKKIKWPDKVKNLELLGKHVNIQAFSDKVDLSSKDGSMTPKGLEHFYGDTGESNT